MFSCCFFNPTSSSKGTQDEADSDTCTVSAKYIEVLRPTNLSTNNNGQPSLAADGQHRRVPDSGNSASRQHVPRSKDNNDTSALGFQQQQQKLQGRGEGGDQPWSEPMHTGRQPWSDESSFPDSCDDASRPASILSHRSSNRRHAQQHVLVDCSSSSLRTCQSFGGDGGPVFSSLDGSFAVISDPLVGQQPFPAEAINSSSSCGRSPSNDTANGGGRGEGEGGDMPASGGLLVAGHAMVTLPAASSLSHHCHRGTLPQSTLYSSGAEGAGGGAAAEQAALRTLRRNRMQLLLHGQPQVISETLAAPAQLDVAPFSAPLAEEGGERRSRVLLLLHDQLRSRQKLLSGEVPARHRPVSLPLPLPAVNSASLPLPSCLGSRHSPLAVGLTGLQRAYLLARLALGDATVAGNLHAHYLAPVSGSAVASPRSADNVSLHYRLTPLVITSCCLSTSGGSFGNAGRSSNGSSSNRRGKHVSFKEDLVLTVPTGPHSCN